MGPVVAEKRVKGSPTCVTDKRKKVYIRDHVDHADSTLAAIIVIQLQHPMPVILILSLPSNLISMCTYLYFGKKVMF